MVVPWQAALEHVEEARRVIKDGEQNVNVVEFEGTGHVGQLVFDPVGYWRVIKDLL
jgi:hypothetical protein